VQQNSLFSLYNSAIIYNDVSQNREFNSENTDVIRKRKKIKAKNAGFNPKVLHSEIQTDCLDRFNGNHHINAISIDLVRNHPINPISIVLKQSDIVCDRLEDHYQEMSDKFLMYLKPIIFTNST
jgi:hypothetical protein